MIVRKDDIDDLKSFLRDEISVEIISNSDGELDCLPPLERVLAFEVNDYDPGEGEFDGEKYAERQGYLYAPATREWWKLAWRIARVLAAGKTAILQTANGPHHFSLPLEVGIY